MRSYKPVVLSMGSFCMLEDAEKKEHNRYVKSVIFHDIEQRATFIAVQSLIMVNAAYIRLTWFCMFTVLARLKSIPLTTIRDCRNSKHLIKKGVKLKIVVYDKAVW